MIKVSESDLNPDFFKYLYVSLRGFLLTGNIATRDIFEKKFAGLIHKKYCFSCHNGTNALYVGLLALGIKAKDEVIVNPFTDVSVISAILNTGAVPVLPLLNAQGFMDLDDLTKRITGKTRVVIATHLNGFTEDLKGLKAIAKKKKIFLLEDACQALGSKIGIGNNLRLAGGLGDLGIFSFGTSKVLTTMEGGMIVTDNHSLASKINILLDKHIYREKGSNITGYNLRLDHLRSALGLAGIDYLKENIAARKRKWDKYCRCLSGIPGVNVVIPGKNTRINYTQCLVFVQSRDKCRRINSLLARAVEGLGHSSESEKHYIKLFAGAGVLESCDYISSHYISLPTYGRLSGKEMDRIIECFKSLR